MKLSEIGLLLYDARKDRRLTLREMAKKIGVSHETVRAIERGECSNTENIAALARALGYELIVSLWGKNTK